MSSTVIAFWPQTGATRLFKSYNLAQEWYPSHNLITRPDEFLEVINHKGEPIIPYHQYHAMFTWIADRSGFNRLDEHTFITKKTNYPATHPRSFQQLDKPLEALWKLAIAGGNWVYHPPYATANKSSRAPLASGFQVDLEKAAKHLQNPPDVPPQVMAIVRALHDNRHDFYTKEEMQQFMLQMQADRKLKTKQDPWRILRYYRNTLANMQVLVYHEKETTE